MSTRVDTAVEQIGVAAIIVSWNTRGLLRQCLDSLVAQSPSAPSEVWVVDNGSYDGSAEMVRREYPGVQLICNSANAGFAAANNQALAHIRRRYVLLLNSDAVVPADGLAGLVETLEATPKAAVVGPMYVYPDGRFQASFGDFPNLRTEMLHALGLARLWRGAGYPSHGPHAAEGRRHVDWVPGTCMLMRMSAVERVGFLDEGFFFYWEEVDLCYRLHAMGWEVLYDPGVVVTHGLGQSSQQNRQAQIWHLYRGRLRFFAKYYGVYRASALKVGLMLALLGRMAMAVRSGRDGLASRVDWRTYWRFGACLWREPVSPPDKESMPSMTMGGH